MRNEEVVASIKSIAAVAEQSAAASEEVSTSSEEQVSHWQPFHNRQKN
ncbi:hypothetical protein [Fictibacillus arsenicus]|nr:hypothetical protein [Fictibacillus arsenicus]